MLNILLVYISQSFVSLIQATKTQRLPKISSLWNIYIYISNTVDLVVPLQPFQCQGLFDTVMVYFYPQHFLKNFYCCSVTVVCLFSPSLHPTPAEPTSLPHLHSPPWFCPCVLYSSSCNPLFPLSPRPSYC